MKAHSCRAFVDARGTLLIGKHKGTNYKAAPPSWVEWAKENIEGFRVQISTIEAMQNNRPTGRTYILKRYERGRRQPA